MVPLTSVVAALLASVPLYANAQLSSLVGTWSSGSNNVQTGRGFANPSNLSFTYPSTTGISYSFATAGTDGQTWYEIARYRFTSNGSHPNCITAVMNWAHGTVAVADNGSLILTPNGDGYQQIQDPCAAVSNFIENYNQTELLVSGYYTYTDTTNGLTLQLYQFDGAPLAPMKQISSTPNMLPTQSLRNVTPATEVVSRRRKRSNSAQQVRQALGDWKLVSIAATLTLAVAVSVL
ncbi:hypothetical protein D9757_007130 [Collybiopsis confluens]|uniref:Protein ROT1 n=1 Tax=Collybiopsis confluens TaxID=2823264 RepID=A0A8H5M4V1_9AGAR|nr:hypothetical protein D9757_014112 [Collybiopsis confluens]KAF5380796.1 hypothetical protein D9757_007130 [Collybiopsis confluens]